MGIYKRGDAYWIDYYFVDELGRRRRKRESVGANRRLAEDLHKKRQNEVMERRYFPERTSKLVRMSDAARDFLEWARVNVGPRSYIRYELSIRNLEGAFGPKNLSEITPAAVEKYKAERALIVKPATVNRDLMVLKRLVNLILKGRLLPDAKVDPMLPARISLFRENNKRIRYLSDKEYEELLAACGRLAEQRAKTGGRGMDLEPIIIVAVNTGLRKSELLNLQWPQVDLDGRSITVLNGKGDVSRGVPVNSVVAALLRGMKERISSPYVFPHHEKGRDSGKAYVFVTNAWRKLVREAKISNLVFHDLRHTCASWLVMKGVHLKTVQEILGHKSYLTTLRYAHLAPELRSEAVERLCDKHPGHILDTKPSGEKKAGPIPSQQEKAQRVRGVMFSEGR